MISQITITNYKSIEHAQFDTRRVNVFIGEPNSGKSNLLEALGFSSPGVFEKVRELFRVQRTADLFFDREIERNIEVSGAGSGGWTLSFNQGGAGRFDGMMTPTVENTGAFYLDGNANPAGQSPRQSSSVRFYRYRGLIKGEWDNSHYGYLLPPYGANLPALLYTSKPMRESISAFFKSKDFRLELRPQENEILMSKEVDDILYSFPFESISETMRRIVFYKAVLESNKDSVLVLDEPEANTFPFYTKYLAERIALDTSNQFFLSTHNPYVLMSIIEKTPQDELAVFVTRMRNYRTEVRQLTPEDCAEALDLGMSLFFNLERFFPE